MKLNQNLMKKLRFWQVFGTPLGILGTILFIAILGPFISGYGFDQTDLVLQNTPPGAQFWLGSDDLGRDLFTRICYGARISLLVGVAAALIDLVIGIIWGGIAGFFGGKVDQLLMASANILYSLPYLLIVILFLVYLGPGLGSLLFALVLIGWIPMARIVRGQVLQVKQQEFVNAAIAFGATPARVLFKHILPNTLGPILVTLTLTIPSAIFAEALLSFIGLGIPPPAASLGTLISEGIGALSYYPWRFFFPVSVLVATVFAFNRIAEVLREEYV